MVACDAAAGTGCTGFVYVGAANGLGGGTCWLKTSMGSFISTGSNYVAAVRGSSPFTPKSSTTTAVTTAVTTAAGVQTKTSNTTLPSSPATLPSGWAYKGCWVDNAHGPILITQISASNTMTIETCVNLCQQNGYSIGGIEYSTQCSCGQQVIGGGTLANQDTDCAMTCGGNGNEICGGPNRMSLFSNSTITVLPPAAPQTSNLPGGGWTYQGCFSDGVNGRTLPNQIILSKTNSPKTCLSLCASYGYMYAGMEYGEECYCGDASDVTAGGSQKVAESDCSMICPGDGTALCGNGNRLTLYAWTAKPFYTFQYPTGISAGSYQYFVPGVVVPLITIPGKNGKITFVEKSGTSEFGNSTGAYELDPSYNGDFSKSWRTMTGITTDVFCSAGLVLPDAGARIINIGGWSGISTYGIRFYTPDGSPGTTSVNMWEENSNEIALQVGRWYPSAMIMANGSILVVGGEDGSNGNPVPSLELLPKAGGTVYCDYLAASDPYNLYPFLAVLPSGNIFISFFNQARVLDPVSLSTINILPIQPGQVTNPTSGRTYPFEGTAVLLPQSAPYTAPLTVLLCGGSGSGASVAIDNCISTQPDVPGANWTLERMPSKRVMSCMVALPDGTFLILNGAKQGVAGFGLASQPNLNAVLYDPSQPINSRMSVLGNTTIARLYHSEAVLMDDGRVLVSGSDPQDNKFPEELRVEVFNPPYILSGAARPTLSVNNVNWNYGQSVTVTVSIPSGAIGNAKISLLGAVASTHGNSMGQRTIFPAYSCSGNTCTITAPPNANICPPGWFQLFVLDGPTPSKAQWIRIGGDPGSLGSWPNYPDFTRPGS